MNNKFKIIGGSILLIGTSLLLSACEQPIPAVENEESEKTAVVLTDYTDDQKKVIDNFGEPDEFTISFHVDDDPKLETWRYVELGEIFVFEDGVYKEAYSVDFGLPEDQVYLKAKIDPKDVYGLTSLKDLEKVLETDATSALEVDETIFEDASFYDFDGVVNAATIGDELVFVRTQSFVAPYKWDELSAKVEEEIANGGDGSGVSDDGAVLGGSFEFDADYGFKVQLPESWEGFDYVEEFDDDNGLAVISIMLPTSDFNYVADGWVPMFTITAYYHGREEDVSPFEEVIGKNNDYLYTFSHMNGFPPEDLENQVKDFESIQKSITLYDL